MSVLTTKEMQTRKQRLIELIEKEFVELEEILIDTPDSMSPTKYRELAERAKTMREALEIIKKQ